jgi:hypothetical protein
MILIPVLTINDTGSTNRMCIVAFTVSPTTITGFCNGNFTTTNDPGTYIWKHKQSKNFFYWFWQVLGMVLLVILLFTIKH